MDYRLQSCISRGGFALGSAAAFLSIGSIGGRAKAAQFEFKCGSDFPADHPSSVRLVQMWTAIEQESGGRIHTQFFPASALGGDAAMLSQVRLGALAFFVVSSANLAPAVPVADIGFLGFAYGDSDDGLRAMDGPLGAYIRQETASRGIYTLRTIWDSGMIQIGSNSHPIKTPADLRGFKIRIPGSKITVDLFKELGASPTPLSTDELYTALQTKLVDGESSPIVSIESQRWYEVNKYVSQTNHQWSGLWLIANGDLWKSMPSDLQDLVERNTTKFGMLERKDVKSANAATAAKLVQQGVAINKVDQTLFRANLKGYYATWSAAFGATPWSLLEQSLGHRLS